MGKKKQPFYRIVVADSRMPRDGRTIEEIGTYNPVARPGRISVDETRVYDWLNKGASPSDTVHSLFHRMGLMRKWAMIKAGLDTETVQLKTELVESDKPRAKSKSKAKTEAKAEAKPEEAGAAKTE
jgi:small subunit ribosomal protein S16